MDETINQTKNVLSLTTRPFQEANVSGKVICSKCYENTKEIKFYLEDAGLIQHFRVKHRHMALDERLVKECRLLFQDLHGQETFSVLQKLAKIRGEANVNCCSLQKYEEFSVEHITENLANKMTTLKVMASTRREAAKLYGLYLKHSGILKHLSGNPCHVRVKISSSVTDHLGQCFKLWDACAKIYAECFVSPKRSMLLPRHQTPVPDKCLQMQISRECKTPLQFLQTVFGHQEFRPGQDYPKSLCGGEWWGATLNKHGKWFPDKTQINDSTLSHDDVTVEKAILRSETANISDNSFPTCCLLHHEWYRWMST
ncbi:uncharacterized protein LOC114530793 [Dendronephthya gigantea]|uniref:uncharacterized protein LOC114530793 n=1 Tax=Dendronephthya gigantea TaxID=151771 RepID=UPI00106A0A23|nr:uncharacterized protein LOC114530793 [Dendronephthya gigantea]